MEEGISQNKIYFKNLDILRFFAVIIVLIAHAFEGYCDWFHIPNLLSEEGNSSQFSTIGKYVRIGITNGGFGVDVFFLISGFLITFILLKEKELFSKINILKFFIRRALRIWPAYFVLLALAPWFMTLTQYQTPDYLPNVFFYNNFHALNLVDSTGNPWQYPFAHLWSICVEEHFYLIWPFVIAFIKTEHLKKTFLVLLSISIAAKIYFYLFNYSVYYTYLHTISRIDVLILGAMFALYFKNNGFQIQTTKLFRIFLYSFTLVLYFADSVYSYDSLFVILVKKYFFCLVFGFAMANYLFNPKTLFKVPFEKLFNYLGKISFGIYLFSNVLVPITAKTFLHRWETDNIWVYFSLNIILSIFVSVIVYELIEKQIAKFKKKFEVVQTSKR